MSGADAAMACRPPYDRARGEGARTEGLASCGAARTTWRVLHSELCREGKGECGQISLPSALPGKKYIFEVPELPNVGIPHCCYCCRLFLAIYW